MSRLLSFDEFLKVPISGDPLTFGDLHHARKGAKLFPDTWVTIAHNTKGARVEVIFQDKRFKYRLNGYAQDRSDEK